MLFSHQNLITAINSRVKEIYERRPLNDAVISVCGCVTRLMLRTRLWLRDAVDLHTCVWLCDAASTHTCVWLCDAADLRTCLSLCDAADVHRCAWLCDAAAVHTCVCLGETAYVHTCSCLYEAADVHTCAWLRDAADVHTCVWWCEAVVAIHVHVFVRTRCYCSHGRVFICRWYCAHAHVITWHNNCCADVCGCVVVLLSLVATVLINASWWSHFGTKFMQVHTMKTVLSYYWRP